MIKSITWIGKSLNIIRNFDIIAKREAGFELDKVQNGLLPSDWKPMAAIGRGAIEIRLHHPHEHRIIYVAKFEEAVYVLHAFEKKTRRTSKNEIEIAKKAYRAMLHWRQKL